MCLEGSCGVCIVTLKRTHPVTKELKTYAVNSVSISIRIFLGRGYSLGQMLGQERSNSEWLNSALKEKNFSK